MSEKTDLQRRLNVLKSTLRQRRSALAAAQKTRDKAKDPASRRRLAAAVDDAYALVVETENEIVRAEARLREIAAAERRRRN